MIDPNAVDPSRRYGECVANVEFPVNEFSSERTLEAMRELLVKLAALVDAR